ncbi:hypothetical protein CDAR_401611 [Caerostris darwini]|uniref:Uncharacterized protein n=1 Tax=Caerostris darwini TaxID=1538125 RepID=A0AAV4RUC8_9ARAC|nr:hypothetical protein CDAR_401611 [Caerostris darwini]
MKRKTTEREIKWKGCWEGGEVIFFHRPATNWAFLKRAFYFVSCSHKADSPLQGTNDRFVTPLEKLLSGGIKKCTRLSKDGVTVPAIRGMSSRDRGIAFIPSNTYNGTS